MLTCGTLINRNYQTSSIFIFILFFCSCSPKQDSISHRTRVLQNRKPILIVRTYTFFSIIYNQKLLYIRARRKKSLISLSFFSKIPVLFFYNYEKITINLGPLSCLVYLSFMTNTSPIYFTRIFFFWPFFFPSNFFYRVEIFYALLTAPFIFAVFSTRPPPLLPHTQSYPLDPILDPLHSVSSACLYIRYLLGRKRFTGQKLPTIFCYYLVDWYTAMILYSR